MIILRRWQCPSEHRRRHHRHLSVDARPAGRSGGLFRRRCGNPAAIEEIRHLMGFDRSLPVQFFDYLRLLAQGDLGTRSAPVSPC